MDEGADVRPPGKGERAREEGRSRTRRPLPEFVFEPGRGEPADL